MKLVAVVVLVAVAACSGSGADTKSKPPVASEPPPPKDCPTRANELGAYLATMDHDPDVVYAKLVERDDLPKTAVDYAPVIVIDGQDIAFQGQLVDGASLVGHLETIAQRIQEDVDAGRYPHGKAPNPHFVHLAFAPDARWDAIVEASEACASAACETDVLFSRASNFVMPPRTPTDDELDQITAGDASNRATQLASVISKIVAPCPALTRAFGEVGEQDDKAGYIIGAVAPGLIECNCAADLDALRSVLARLLGNQHPTTAVALRIDRKGTKIALPATTLWRDAAAKIPASGGAVWFALP